MFLEICFYSFANKTIPLPPGWEKKAAGNTPSSRYNQSGRSNRKQTEFFVNHNDMYTTYIDPRYVLFDKCILTNALKSSFLELFQKLYTLKNCKINYVCTKL